MRLAATGLRTIILEVWMESAREAVRPKVPAGISLWAFCRIGDRIASKIEA